MKNIALGDANGHGFGLNIDRLIKTRLLIQGGSGSGKSWLCRRIAEQIFGHVPVVIIDPEGEFATLRERFGYVLVGEGGETPADPRSAELVAHKVFELHASAVCDLFEMKPDVRSAWVAAFLEALIDAPKTLWHQLIVIVDEAHMFCPERGAGESAASDGMIALATRGRKRGFVPIFATQRISKMRKDAIAELQNVLIGRTFIDLDRDRAIDTLGVARSERETLSHGLKTLKSGQFWAFGPALTLDRTLVDVGGVITTHPKVGSGRRGNPPPAPEAVRAMLPQLADLPAEAEREARTAAQLKTKVNELTRTVHRLESDKARVEAAPKMKPVSVMAAADRKRLDGLRLALTRLGAEIAETITAGHEMVGVQIGRLEQQRAYLDERGKDIADAIAMGTKTLDVIDRAALQPAVPTLAVDAAAHIVPRTQPIGSAPDGTSETLQRMERKILEVLAQAYPEPRLKKQLTLLTGYAWSGGFSNALGRLRKLGLLSGRNTDAMLITDSGRAVVGPVPPKLTGDALRTYWLNSRTLQLMDRALLGCFIQAGAAGLSKDALLAASGYAWSGGLSNSLGKLRRLNLISGTNGETMRADMALVG